VNYLLKKRLLILALTQLAIIAISFIAYHNLTLMSYINISFYFSAVLLLTSLLVYTVHSGFLDVISRSFTLAFQRGSNKRRFDEIPPLSGLITFNQKPLVFYGLINGLFMTIALVIYYF
jgi:small-conductance mechanosensitive channel